MPVRMIPLPPSDNRMVELDAILLKAHRDLVASPNRASGASVPPRRPPHRADHIIHNLTTNANAWATESKRAEDERMAIVEGERERQLIREAEHYAELAFLRAKGAA